MAPPGGIPEEKEKRPASVSGTISSDGWSGNRIGDGHMSVMVTQTSVKEKTKKYSKAVQDSHLVTVLMWERKRAS